MIFWTSLNRDSYKTDTCQNLIDLWRVLRHLQYNISDNIDKIPYDVRASEPYHGGTEPLMKIRIMDKNGLDIVKKRRSSCGKEE